MLHCVTVHVVQVMPALCSLMGMVKTVAPSAAWQHTAAAGRLQPQLRPSERGRQTMLLLLLPAMQQR